MKAHRLGGIAIPVAAAAGYAVLSLLWIAFWNSYLSDAAQLANLAEKGSYYSLREWLFVCITSFAIYLVLAIILPRVPVQPSQTLHGEEAVFPMVRVITIVFALLTLTVSISGFLNYYGFRERVIELEKREVSAITLLKRDQIARWFEESSRELEVVSSNRYITRELHDWMVGAGARGVPPERVVERLAVLQRINDYRAIWLTDAKGNPVYSVRGSVAQTSGRLEQQLAIEAMRRGKAVVGSDSESYPEMAKIAVAVPLSWQPANGKEHAFGSIVGEVDPEPSLLPRISNWPVPSETARSLLALVNGTHKWVYLEGNLPRKARQKALPPQVDAILEQLSLGLDFPDNEATDWRNQRLIIATHRVPDTHWVVVGVMAMSEVLAPLNTLAVWSAAAVGMALVISALLSVLAWRYQHALQVIGGQRLQIERHALVQHYDYLTKYANDLIILCDESGRVVEANDRVFIDSGYSREELLKMNLRDLMAPGEKVQFEQSLDKADAEGIIFESPLLGKDGQSIFVEISARAIESGGKHYLQCIMRNIEERKEAERNLERANRALRTLSAGNVMLLHAADEAALLEGMCRIIVETGGYHLAWIGFAENDPDRTVRPVAHAGYDDGYMERASVTWADTVQGSGPAGMAIRTQSPQVVQDAHHDESYAPWRVNAAHLGYGSVLAVPFTQSADMRGVICIYSSAAGAFTEEEIDLLAELANDLGYGLNVLRIKEAQAQSSKKLIDSMESSIEAIAATLEMRDPYTAGHQHRVAELSGAIAREMGLSDNDIHGIVLAAKVHDLGKIQIPAEILSKPSRLNAVEYELIKTHSQSGYTILKDIYFPWPIAQMVQQHHERMDGSGYPGGLAGPDILLGARILAVADVLEAMASHRPYRPAVGIEAALEEIKRGIGSAYDPAAAEACLKLFREQRFAFDI